jgi:hypothetical protein
MVDFHILEWIVVIYIKNINLTVNKVLCKNYLLIFYILCKQTCAFYVSQNFYLSLEVY